LSLENKLKCIKGTLIVRFPKISFFIQVFKFISIYKQFITKLRIYSECTSNSLPSYTFTTVISYYLFTNIFGLIDGSRENLKIIWKVYIELSKIWVHRWIELIELHRTQVFSELIQWIWAAFTRICSQNLIKELQYFEIFWTIVWATENLIAPLDRARRVVQDTLVSCLDTG
jgi:hypothetical protein